MSWSMDLDPKGANNQLKENADKFYSKDEDLLFGMEDIASSVTDVDQSQIEKQKDFCILTRCSCFLFSFSSLNLSGRLEFL